MGYIRPAIQNTGNDYFELRIIDPIENQVPVNAQRPILMLKGLQRCINGPSIWKA